MQMIDVLKRLAQLDATTPAIDTGAAVVKPEQGVSLSECGPMGMMDSMGAMGQPHSPASINMTAATGEELSGMLKDIMSLAGINKSDAGGMDQLGVASEPMDLTAEPEVSPGAGPGATDGEVMRSVLDKLNPEDGEETDGEENPFGGDDDGVSKAHGDIDGDGDHDMDDHDAEKDEEDEEADEGLVGGVLGGAAGAMMGGPAGAALGYAAGSKAGDDLSDEEKETDETYDGPQYSTTPNDPNKDRQGYDQEGVGPNNHENQPGAGDTILGKSRTRVQPTATFENLMKEYKSFIGESEEAEEDEDMEEGIEDRLKDLDPKNPVNIPAYKRKAASGDSADAARNTKESANESMADILKLSGLR